MGLSTQLLLVAAALLACSVPARAQACPSVTTTTACYAGITGPPTMVTLALSQLAQLGLLLPSGTPLPINTTTNQPCVSATVTCTTLQTLAPGYVTNQVCPSTLSLTAYLPIPNTTQAVGMNCSTSLLGMAAYGFTALAVCSTTNCNAPTATSYITGSLAFDGYTTATFGTQQAARFVAALATATGVATSSVSVTGVTAVSNVAAPAGRRLAAAGISVAYAISTTLSLSGPIVTALTNAPPTAAQMTAAGLTGVTTTVAASAPGGASTQPAPAAGLPNTSTSAAPAVRASSTALLAAALLAALLACA